jgi:hypothetical protein
VIARSGPSLFLGRFNFVHLLSHGCLDFATAQRSKYIFENVVATAIAGHNCRNDIRLPPMTNRSLRFAKFRGQFRFIEQQSVAMPFCSFLFDFPRHKRSPRALRFRRPRSLPTRKKRKHSRKNARCIIALATRLLLFSFLLCSASMFARALTVSRQKCWNGPDYVLIEQRFLPLPATNRQRCFRALATCRPPEP